MNASNDSSSCSMDEVMDKVRRYNELFDGTPNRILTDEMRAVVDDLWDPTLQIAKPNGSILYHSDFVQTIESYLKAGLSTELLLLEPETGGIRYRVRATLPAAASSHRTAATDDECSRDDNPATTAPTVMTLESIARVNQEGKIVQVRPAPNSDMSQFLDRTSGGEE